ncbi:hypothetical protein M885DRAFT_575567, partial [Pelagophyceae sp. CCMP2097]
MLGATSTTTRNAARGSAVRNPSQHRLALSRDLHRGDTDLALRPRDPALPVRLATAFEDSIALSAPKSTLRKDDSAWVKYWLPHCVDMGTSPLRTDAAVNAGYDVEGHRDEVFLLCSFFVRVTELMRPRRKTDAQAKPASVMAVVSAVRRRHKRLGHTMASTTQLGTALVGAKRAFVLRHGPEALQPERKEPYSQRVLAAVRGVKAGTAIAGRVLYWSDSYFIAWWAAVMLTREAGFRKAEVTVTAGDEFGPAALSYASIVWRIAGKLFAAPTAAQLMQLSEADAVAVKPGPSKADQFGDLFGSMPIWLPFNDNIFNAANNLRNLELLHWHAVHPANRATTPLFPTSRAGRAPLTAT